MPKEFHDMAEDIKAKGGAKNPFAVARSILGSDKQIAMRRGKKPMHKMPNGKMMKGKSMKGGY